MADQATDPTKATGAQGDTKAPETGTEKTPEQKLAEQMTDKGGEKKPDGTPEDKAPDGDKQPPAAIGDDWKPTLPEGATLDDAALTEARTTLKGLGLNAEQAQKAVDAHLAMTRKADEARVEAWKSQVAAWEGDIKARPEFKDGFEQKQAIANRAFSEFFDETERKYLADSGIASYLFPAMYKAGLKIAEPQAEADGKPKKPDLSGDPTTRLARMYEKPAI